MGTRTLDLVVERLFCFLVVLVKFFFLEDLNLKACKEKLFMI